MGMVTLNDKAIITITPVNLDGSGNYLNKGAPIEVTLADFITYLQTHTGWTA